MWQLNTKRGNIHHLVPEGRGTIDELSDRLLHLACQCNIAEQGVESRAHASTRSYL